MQISRVLGVLCILGLSAHVGADKSDLCAALNERNCVGKKGVTFGCTWIPLIHTCMFVDRSSLQECHQLLTEQECVDPLHESKSILTQSCEWIKPENKCAVASSTPVAQDSFDDDLARRVGIPKAKVVRTKPSFLILLADDVGYGDVSYINPTGLYTTPNIDAMAAHPNALQMNNFHCSAITCSPSRSSLLSGVQSVRECVWSAKYVSITTRCFYR